MGGGEPETHGGERRAVRAVLAVGGARMKWVAASRRAEASLSLTARSSPVTWPPRHDDIFILRKNALLLRKVEYST